jgi:hypothetical protein
LFIYKLFIYTYLLPFIDWADLNLVIILLLLRFNNAFSPSWYISFCVGYLFFLLPTILRIESGPVVCIDSSIVFIGIVGNWYIFFFFWLLRYNWYFLLWFGSNENIAKFTNTIWVEIIEESKYFINFFSSLLFFILLDNVLIKSLDSVLDEYIVIVVGIFWLEDVFDCLSSLISKKLFFEGTDNFCALDGWRERWRRMEENEWGSEPGAGRIRR